MKRNRRRSNRLIIVHLLAYEITTFESKVVLTGGGGDGDGGGGRSGAAGAGSGGRALY